VSKLRARLESLGAVRLREFKASPPAPSRHHDILVVLGSAALWAALFAWLAVQRYLAGGAHAEDLGFTDQVLNNFLGGQLFRMSIYASATWNTELDISRLARPDSLLAFHFEPMLLLLVPLYALGGGAAALLTLQALAVAAGAVPAYSLGRLASGSSLAGIALAAAYLLSPFGQWAVLADFHTSTLAAPLLLLAVERLVVKNAPLQALAACALAATAREDVGLVVALLGFTVLLRQWRVDLARSLPARWRKRRSLPKDSARPEDSVSLRLTGVLLILLGLGSTAVAALVIRAYSGGVSPFAMRYGDSSPGALLRPSVLDFATTLLLSGGWLGLLSPLAMLPALPSLALNGLSASPWMAAGKAHYSALVLPFVVVGAAAGLYRLRARPRLVQLAGTALVLTAATTYLREGTGPLGANYAPAYITEHATQAASVAASLPPDTAVSASSSLVPRLTTRPRVYVFPAVLDAEYVFIDLQASPAPTSAGDVFLRVQTLLAEGGWQVETANDGLLLLRRAPDSQPTHVRALSLSEQPRAPTGQSVGTYYDGRVSLLSADLVPSPDGALDVDGPRWILRTVFRPEEPLPSGTRFDFWLELRDGQDIHVWDVADAWWNPPENWTPHQPVVISIRDVPVRQFVSWQVVFSRR
jgi:uncharacterized membrane protein